MKIDKSLTFPEQMQVLLKEQWSGLEDFIKGLDQAKEGYKWVVERDGFMVDNGDLKFTYNAREVLK